MTLKSATLCTIVLLTAQINLAFTRTAEIEADLEEACARVIHAVRESRPQQILPNESAHCVWQLHLTPKQVLSLHIEGPRVAENSSSLMGYFLVSPDLNEVNEWDFASDLPGERIWPAVSRRDD